MTEQRPKSKSLPEKKFELRESTLSKVCKNEHVNAVNKFGLIVVFNIILGNTLNDIYYGGTSEFGLKLIKIGFAKLDKTFLLWMLIIILHIIVFIGWNIWRKLRPRECYLWDRIWISTLFLYLFGGFHYITILMFEMKIPIASRAIILGETTRLLMKSYAFVRTNCYEYLSKGNTFENPTFSKFMYFSFAPTLIYKNEYPRWPSRSFKTMGKYLVEILFIIYTLSILEERYCITPLQNFGKESFSFLDICLIVTDKIFPCFIAWILFARVALHSTQSFFAELLQFGDREFHKDWWNSTCLSEFHLSWNVLIQDWLFHYVYKDFYEYITPKNKFASRLAVYILSMVLHEVLSTYIIGIKCPIYICFMTISLLMTFSKTTDMFCNKFTLFNIVLGQSLLVIVPHLEYFAKQNCPQTTEDFLYVPKLYTCFK